MASNKDSLKGIVIEIGGDTTKLGNALTGVSEQSRKLQSELKGVNSLLKLDPSNVTLLQQKQDILNESIATTREKLEKLKDAQSQVQEQFESGAITVEQYRDFQREIIATEEKLKSLEKEAKNFGSVTAQQIAVAGKKVEKLGNNVENVGKKMSKVAAAIVAVGTASVVVGANFESSMLQVAATMGITADEIQNGSESYKILEEAAKKCGETTKYSATESADALNYLALAGYDAEKSAETLPKVLNLAAAGNLELATASDMVTDAMAALNMETKDLDKYIDEMARTSQKSNTSVAQLGEATLTCAGTVSMAGMSLETMNTELGILANNGIKGAEGGTHLRNIILSLTSPTDTASEALKKLGINVLDSSGNIRDLNDIMQEFESKLGKLSDGEKTEVISTIFNKTDISAVNALIKGSGEEFSKLNSEISNCSGTAQDMADTMNSGLSAQITLLKSQLEAIGIQIAEILMPILKDIVNIISKVLTWISSLNPATQKIIGIITGIVAAIGPLLIFIGKIISSVGTIMKAVPKIVSIVKTIKTAISGLFSLLAANPIILIIAGITALVAGFMYLWKNCESFRNFWINLWESIKIFFSKVVEWIKEKIESIKNTFNLIVNFLKDILKNIKSSIDAFFSAIGNIGNWVNKNIIQPIIDAIKGFLNTIKSIADWIYSNVIQPTLNIIVPIVSKIGEIIAKIWEIITVLFGVLCQWIYDNIIMPIITIIQEFVLNVIQFFNDIWNGIVEIFSVVSQWIYDNVIIPIITTIQEFVLNVIQFFNDIWNGIVEIYSVVSQWFSNLFNQAKEFIIIAFTPIIQWFSDRWNDIKNIFSVVADFFKNIFQAAWNNIKSAFSSVGSFFQGIWNTIKNMFTNIGSTIGDGISGAFRSVVNSVISFAENVINNLIRAINRAIGTINNIPGVNIGTIGELNIPKLKVGLDYVPYDNYLAFLHKGERVMTAKENKDYTNGSNDSPTEINNYNSLNLNIGEFNNNRKQDVQGLMEEMEYYKDKCLLAKGEKT